MDIMLILMILALICIIIFQYNENKKISRDLNYVMDKLDSIIETESLERVKVVTANKQIQRLAGTINKLLDYNSDNLLKYRKTKKSMKKMLSNVSHDLKTPLTVILGYVEILRMNNKEDIMINKIQLKAKEVLELINKFFDLAKLESGDKEIEISKVNISELCRMNILGFYDSLTNDEIEAHIDIPEKNIYVLGNEEAINRILNNLISNAVKYGSTGKYLGIEVEENSKDVNIKVIDRGKGIEDKYKEEVFERIFTLEDSRSKSYQGSGLGLTITKHLVEELGGEIHLSSIPNKETIFSFKLNKIDY